MDINDWINKTRSERREPVKPPSYGVVIAKVSDDKRKGVALYLSCQTYFTARLKEIVNLAFLIIEKALNSSAMNAEEVLTLAISGRLVKDILKDKSRLFKEDVGIALYEILEGQSVYHYNHLPDFTISSLVSLNIRPNPIINIVGHDLAMQVAAMNPLAITPAGISAETIEKLRIVAREKILHNSLRKYSTQELETRINRAVEKYLEQNALLTQIFIKDKTVKVQQFLDLARIELQVTGMKRLSAGTN